MTHLKSSSLGKRVVTGAILLVLLAATLVLGGWYFAAVAFIATAIAIHEELNALKAGGHAPVRWAAFAALVLALPCVKLFSSSLVIMPILTVLAFCVSLQVMRRESPLLEDIMFSLLPMLTLVLPCMCLIGISLSDDMPHLSKMLLVLVFAIAVGGDTFAYFVGSALRGPKLCPNISPNKTISGAVGGLVGSLITALLVGLIAWLFAVKSRTVLPAWWHYVLLGLIGGVAGQLGDLFASLIKRHCGLKDFSNLFPGHGGMLDRLDSVIFMAVIIFCYRMLTVL